MKSLNKTISLFFFTLLITLLSSCTRDIFDVADRYKVVFWFDEETSRQLLYDGADTLTFYVNYKAVATSTVDDIFWTTAPSCDDTTAISVQLSLLHKENPIIFYIEDQNGAIYYSGTKSLSSELLSPGYCNTIELK